MALTAGDDGWACRHCNGSGTCPYLQCSLCPRGGTCTSCSGSGKKGS